VLRLEPGREPDAHLELATNPMNLTIPLGQLDEGPVVAEASDPARTVRVQRLPTGLPAAGCAGSQGFESPQLHGLASSGPCFKLRSLRPTLLGANWEPSHPQTNRPAGRM